MKKAEKALLKLKLLEKLLGISWEDCRTCEDEEWLNYDNCPECLNLGEVPKKVDSCQ